MVKVEIGDLIVLDVPSIYDRVFVAYVIKHFISVTRNPICNGVTLLWDNGQIENVTFSDLEVWLATPSYKHYPVKKNEE